MNQREFNQTYSRTRRLLINQLKHYIKERDESRITSIFCEYTKIDSQYIAIFIDNNNQLCQMYLNSLLEEFETNSVLPNEFREMFEKEIFFAKEATSIELVYYFILYITVEEFNAQLRKINLPFERPLDENGLVDNSINNQYFFRGQTKGWDIAPSVIRELKQDIKIDNDGLNHLYEECDLNKKYNELFCDYTSKRNLYYKVAFMQHACAFSPLIDFTKKAIVATSFALSNTNQFNVFNSEKSYVYRLIIDRTIKVIDSKQEASDFLKTINYFCIHINDDFVYGKTFFYDEYRGGVVTRKSLIILTPIDLYNALKPKLVIFDSPTNDRMKYQSGIFVLFYDYVSFKGELRYWYAPGFSILSYPINPRSKRKILRSIHTISEGWYESNLLVNPYEIFNK